eukprot:3550851-Prymnesium_polylepis.1
MRGDATTRQTPAGCVGSRRKGTRHAMQDLAGGGSTVRDAGSSKSNGRLTWSVSAAMAGSKADARSDALRTSRMPRRRSPPGPRGSCMRRTSASIRSGPSDRGSTGSGRCPSRNDLHMQSSTILSSGGNSSRSLEFCRTSSSRGALVASVAHAARR